MGKVCCSIEDKRLNGNQEHNHTDSDHDHHDHNHELTLDEGVFKIFAPAIFSFIALISAVLLQYVWKPIWFIDIIQLLWYAAAYIPVGYPVIKDAISSIRYADFFSEFLLMTIATVGAFAIGEYPEAVAVMLFYTVGEIFQSLAVTRAKTNIEDLLDQRPEVVTVVRGNDFEIIAAKDAQIGDVVQLKVGEELALDGVLLSKSASFNTSALTGESKPDTKYEGDTVLAGMINHQSVSQVQVSKEFSDSKLSQILTLVEDAASRKAPTELFIRKFAKIYTPIVVYLAIAITLLPYFFVQDYVFQDWLYRALIFLVISCPCALVISIPLGYFGGIGAASKHGILFKGGNFLDALAQVDHVVMDKTGTMTEGIFEVQEVIIQKEFSESDILEKVNLLESYSSHPIATAIEKYVGVINRELPIESVEEIAGYGLKAIISGEEFLAGNFKLLDKFSISYDINPDDIVHTTIAMAQAGKFVGYITIADKIKSDAAQTIDGLHKAKVQTTMLSGDKPTVVDWVAKTLKIDHALGGLLPEDKVAEIEKLKAQGQLVVFVGDGINDAPAMMLSDVGIAMGGLGSDTTIEAADVVIQDDNPSKIPVAIRIGQETKKIVWQNMALAFGVKAIVLILGAGGIATMWEAVFADVGVALIAIFNAIRIQRMKF